MKEKILCPSCKKRMFDIRLEGKAKIEIKCLHCKNVVIIKRKDEAEA